MRILNLARYGTHGWQWECEREHDYRDETVRDVYRTNSNGEGLWRERWNAWGTYQGYQQELGTAQFSLSEKRDTARRQLRRYWSRTYQS